MRDPLLPSHSPDLDMNLPPPSVLGKGQPSRLLPDVESLPNGFVDRRAREAGPLGVLGDPVGQISHPPPGALQNISLNTPGQLTLQQEIRS